MRDIPTMVDGVTTLPADLFNDIPSEIENAVTSSGQTLTPIDGTNSDLFQLAKAMSVYAAGGEFYSDSGTANSYVLSPIGSKQSPPSYFDGMKVAFFTTNANTSTSTVNVATLGSKQIRTETGAQVAANDLNGFVELRFSSTNDHFILTYSTSSNFKPNGLYSNAVDYPVNSYVKGSDGYIYKALIANGPSSTVVNPVGDSTSTWASQFRALKGAPSGTNSQEGYTFELDGDTGLFAEGGDSTSNSDIVIRSDNIEIGRFTKSDKNSSSVGYVILPSGIIIQWGTGSSNASGVLTQSFPIVFPNAILQYYGVGNESSFPPISRYVATNSTLTNNSQISLFITSGGSPIVLGLRWLAIGF